MEELQQSVAFSLIKNYFAPLKIELHPEPSNRLSVMIGAEAKSIVLNGVHCPADLTTAKVFELISNIESRIAEEAPEFTVSEEVGNALRQYR